MARPRKEEKTEYIDYHFKLTLTKSEMFEQCYEKSGCRSKTQFLMDMVMDYDRIKKLQDIDDTMFDEVLQHRRLILNIANNINQIAKQVNTSGYAATDNEIKNLLIAVENFIPELKNRSDELLKKSNTFLRKVR